MTGTSEFQSTTPPVQRSAAWERRLRAIWYDYLQTTQGVAGDRYDEIERNAWERLQRRLRRNDELASMGR